MFEIQDFTRNEIQDFTLRLNLEVRCAVKFARKTLNFALYAVQTDQLGKPLMKFSYNIQVKNWISRSATFIQSQGA